jgi:3-oxoacyl-[acyl-carrier protein] reductase
MNPRRQSFFETWVPAYNLTVEGAIEKFPELGGISRFGKPEEIADLMSYVLSLAAKWMTGDSQRMRRDQWHLSEGN